MDRTKSGMGIMTAGLWMLAVGTIGPIALLLLSGLLAMGGALTAKPLFLLMVIGSYAGFALVASALLGQILCLLSPLEVTSKIALAVTLSSLLANQFVVSTQLLILMAAVSFVAFLYGVCNDLESPELKEKIGSALKFFLVAALLSYLMPSFVRFLGKGTIVVALATLSITTVGLVKYSRAIVELARKANVLRSLTD